MNDLGQALTDIKAMRSQMARAETFRGYGPVAFGFTGLLAAASAFVQARFLPPGDWLPLWMATAALAGSAIGVDMVVRSRRAHSGLANEMIEAAALALLPCLGAGALLTAVVWRSAPAQIWMLPGLWQMVLALGIFSACRALPAALNAVGFWYLCTSLVCLVAGSVSHQAAPWEMGVPFAFGQVLSAILIAVFSKEGADE